MRESGAGNRLGELDAQTSRLRRMRAAASGILVAMAAVFVAASLVERRWPAVSYLRAFAEAAVVGGCADWFAITALFRRPFGLPIPHTGLVPRNKDRIGAALGRFIADNFLTVPVLDARLRRIELAAWGADWLERPDNARSLARRLAALAPAVLDALPAEALKAIAGAAALAAVNATPAAPTAARLLEALWRSDRADAVIQAAAERLAAWLAENEAMILEQVQAQTYKWLPQWVDRMIAERITRGLVRLLTDVRDPAHPLRGRLAAEVERLIERLANDPELMARGEAIKARLVGDPRLAAEARAAWSSVERGLGAALRDRAPQVGERLEQAIGAFAAWLRREPRVQQGLNLWARTLVRRVIAPRRHEIGRFVAAVVSSWDAAVMVEKLELQAGPDLQYIRINGALVGGLVGLVLYAVAKALRLA